MRQELLARRAAGLAAVEDLAAAAQEVAEPGLVAVAAVGAEVVGLGGVECSVAAAAVAAAADLASVAASRLLAAEFVLGLPVVGRSSSIEGGVGRPYP